MERRLITSFTTQNCKRNPQVQIEWTDLDQGITARFTHRGTHTIEEIAELTRLDQHGYSNSAGESDRTRVFKTRWGR